MGVAGTTSVKYECFSVDRSRTPDPMNLHSAESQPQVEVRVGGLTSTKL